MLATLKQEGKIRHVGLSNVTIAQIEAARRIVEVASVQNRLSISDRTGEDVLDYCTQHNIAFIPHGSLGAHPLKQGAPLAKAEGSVGRSCSTPQRKTKSNRIGMDAASCAQRCADSRNNDDRPS